MTRVAADFLRLRLAAKRIEQKTPVINSRKTVGMAGGPVNGVEELERYAALGHLFGRFCTPGLGRAQADDEYFHMRALLRRGDYRGRREICAIFDSDSVVMSAVGQKRTLMPGLP